jgi:hypothetical protein
MHTRVQFGIYSPSRMRLHGTPQAEHKSKFRNVQIIAETDKYFHPRHKTLGVRTCVLLHALSYKAEGRGLDKRRGQ